MSVTDVSSSTPPCSIRLGIPDSILAIMGFTMDESCASAWEQLRDDNQALNWLVCGYTGKEAVTVKASGEGG